VTQSTDAELRPRQVELKRKALEHYRTLAGDDLIGDVRSLAHELRGLRVLELSSTATGGGVAEMLSSLVPLERDAGLDAEWRLLAGDPTFFAVTKKLHNGLQGMRSALDDAERDAYLRLNEQTARALGDDWDVVVAHDPQPAAVRSFLDESSARWLWRCHVDTSEPDRETWEFLRPYVEAHDRAAFTLDEFAPPDLDLPTTTLVPAIDPLTSKNRPLPAYLARETVQELGIDLARPLLLQVSRFDPWKDPLGVVEIWRRVREQHPDLQLALVGSMATDDPQGWDIYQQVQREARGEDGFYLFTDQMGVTHHEVNALQRVADVVVQKSTREGFGLIVSETLWKGTPIVAGRAGGIPSQLEDGRSGFLAATVDEFADRVVELLQDPVLAKELGTAGVHRVRERFLLPRLLRDRLLLLRELLDR
jgi:trehalose synthase